MFITFEGIDGSGKSTQSRLLCDALEARGYEVILTREPGGSSGAEAIRKLLVEGDQDRWSPETELLLFNAARRDHLEKTIEPSLEAGKVVICDRFVDSTRAYQATRNPALKDKINQLHQSFIEREADITILIDTDPDQALKRGLARNSGEDRFETLGNQFQHDLRKAFLDLAASAPKRFHVINGDQAIAAISADVFAAIEPELS